jgi:Lrp/AsnC family transcriptional regulator, leucine-responsive regulatory protein
MSPARLDKTDRRLLALLTANARLSYKELGEAVGLSTAAAFQRVRKLEAAGIVTGYHAQVSAEAIGRGVVAFIFLEVIAGNEGTERLISGWRSSGDATECHRLSSGRYLVKVRLPDVGELEGLLQSAAASGARATAEIALRALFGDVQTAPSE